MRMLRGDRCDTPKTTLELVCFKSDGLVRAHLIYVKVGRELREQENWYPNVSLDIRFGREVAIHPDVHCPAAEYVNF
jgi:hypothetical protein